MPDAQERPSILKLIDLPPLWLALFVVLARIQTVRLPVGRLDSALIDLVAGLLVGGGLLIMAVAAVQMRQNQTTIMPHRHASRLITNGVFSRSRNPIYLADTMLLVGLILLWRAWPSLLLVPLFIWVITDRFILDEEQRLEQDFGPGWILWAKTVRRWL